MAKSRNSKKKKATTTDDRWAEARRKCRLDAETVRMAKELGLNPLSLIKNIPNPREPWKAPVGEWVRGLYEKRFGRAERTAAERGGAAQRCDTPARRKPVIDGSRAVPAEPSSDSFPRLAVWDESGDDAWARRRTAGGSAQPPSAALPGADDSVGPIDSDDLEAFDEDDWDPDEPPSDQDIREQNDLLLRRQREFRTAAEWVTRELAKLPVVTKVALFGSVASPLKKEVPRFREFRRAGVEVWHECKDVDLAVWITDTGDLKRLKKASSRALNALLERRNIGVAHHQVDMFLLEPDTDRYLGRLCCFGVCPKEFKPECQVPGCGASRFLQQHANFTFHADSLAPGRAEVLFDRGKWKVIPEPDEAPF